MLPDLLTLSSLFVLFDKYKVRPRKYENTELKAVNFILYIDPPPAHLATTIQEPFTIKVKQKNSTATVSYILLLIFYF